MENSSNTKIIHTSEVTQASDYSSYAKKFDEDDGLVELMELLEDIDETKAAAKLNEVSMISNNGSRIYY